MVASHDLTQAGAAVAEAVQGVTPKETPQSLGVSLGFA